MRLIRVGPHHEEIPGLLMPDGTRRDARAVTDDYTPAFFAENGLQRLSQWAEEHADHAPRLDLGARLGPPITRPGKLICIGLNYKDHARESGMEPPDEPVVFFKATTAVCGPDDGLVIPRGGDKTDGEVELAVMIGRRASCVGRDEAMGCVAGYMLHNDYSERVFQLERGGQWVKGKSCDTFAPLGPFLATADEVPDPHALRLWLDVNGKRMQDGSTENLIFDIPTLVSYLSGFMTLEPGDIISTGTPAGVGLGLKPPVYLRPGDVVELGIDGLGRSRQTARAWTPTAPAC
jgi:2-keto-4-pentenoate hydratase/2-oxohepta-3-ene-1,7-dioic acid hydratase in catechol pathway